MTIGLVYLPPYSPTDCRSEDIAPCPPSPSVVTLCFTCWVLAGLCQNSILPLLFEFFVEITYPAAESTTAPVMAWTASWMSLVFIAVFGAVLGNTPSEGDALAVLYITTALCCVGALLMLLIRSDLKRHLFELSHHRHHHGHLTFVEDADGGNDTKGTSS